MRLLHGSFLLPALAGIARAETHATSDAEAYILQKPRDTTTAPASSSAPSIPHDLAQAILLQRISTPDQPSPLGQLPDNEADAIAYVNQFGRPASPLFGSNKADNAPDSPKQLIIAFSGATDDIRQQLRAAASDVDLSFTSPHLSSLPTEERQQCIFKRAIDPNDKKCWHGLTTQVLRVDASQEANAASDLGSHIAALKERAEKGEMETVILFFADKNNNSDDDDNSELRRREFVQKEQEQVMTEYDNDDFLVSASPSAKSSASDKEKAAEEGDDDDTPHAEPSSSVYPACFTSYDACMSGTSDCSGHGECAARWTGEGKGDDTDACYVCRCLQTTEKGADGREGLYRWGGAACQKIDVSTPFWLFAGVTIALVGTVTFAVGLLFSVGEQKLPGVIGAGVSKGGK